MNENIAYKPIGVIRSGHTKPEDMPIQPVYATGCRGRAEVITDSRGVHAEGEFVATRQAVLQLLQRRPCSAEGIARGLGIQRNEAAKHVQELLAQGLVECVSSAQGTYLRALQRPRVPSSHRRNEHAGEKGPR